jgi:hypothetical protein
MRLRTHRIATGKSHFTHGHSRESRSCTAPALSQASAPLSPDKASLVAALTELRRPSSFSIGGGDVYCLLSTLWSVKSDLGTMYTIQSITGFFLCLNTRNHVNNPQNAKCAGHLYRRFAEWDASIYYTAFLLSLRTEVTFRRRSDGRDYLLFSIFKGQILTGSRGCGATG